MSPVLLTGPEGKGQQQGTFHASVMASQVKGTKPEDASLDCLPSRACPSNHRTSTIPICTRTRTWFEAIGKCKVNSCTYTFAAISVSISRVARCVPCRVPRGTGPLTAGENFVGIWLADTDAWATYCTYSRPSGPFLKEDCTDCFGLITS